MSSDHPIDTQTTSKRLLRGLGQLGVIVVGVLVALSADAWWQDREEGVREITYLRALQEELAQAETALGASIRHDSANVAIDTAFTRQLMADLEVEPYGFTVVFTTNRVPTGTLDALTRTGEIHLIRSDRLRSMIITHAGLWESLKDALGRFDEQLLDSWSRSLDQMAAARVDLPGGPSGATEELRALRTTPGFIGNRLFHDDMLRNRLSINRDLRRSAAALHLAVTEELAARE